MTRSQPQSRTTWNKAQWEIYEAFRDSAYTLDQMDVQTGRLWDSVAYTAGSVVTSANSSLFSNVGAVSGKTIADSNMQRACELVPPDAFAIKRILFTFNVNALNEDVYALAESMVFNLRLGRKSYAEGLLISMQTAYSALAPLRICEYCNGVYISANACPNCGASQFRLSSVGMTEEAPGRTFYTDVSPCIVINCKCMFCVSFALPDYTTRGPIKLWCHLEGLHARGVQ